MYRPLWIEIDLQALRDNFNAIKKTVGSHTKIIATVKQNAYGHGVLPVARELSKLGVDFFGVGSIEEAIVLREHGFKEPILVLSAILPFFAKTILQYKITPTVADTELARVLDREAARHNKKIPIHIKVDTGMGRLGPYHTQAHAFIQELARLKHLTLEGIYTHFPVADADKKFTDYQIKIFNTFIEHLRQEQGASFKYQHCANSAGVLHYPHAHFNVVRPGLILYGIKPSVNVKLRLTPLLTLKSKVIYIKRIEKDMTVSYGRTYKAKSPRFIATVSIGYADGYPWSLSNRSKVLIRNSFYNVIGRVCMDHVMVDLGRSAHAKVGDDVILIGKSSPRACITPELVAEWAKTIPYEIVSRLSLKIPRLFKNPAR